MAHWQSNFKRVCFSFGVVLLWTLAWGAAPCLAFEARTVSVSRSSNIPSVWADGVAIADFDGDGRPDLAIVKETSSDRQDSRYRVELHLTTRARPTYFSVSAGKGGLRLVPRDLDGDRDLDLILVDAWSDLPVGVWINDSHGDFTPGDPRAYSRSLWTDTPETVSNTPQHIYQAALAQPSRSSIAAPPVQSLSSNLVSDFLPSVAPATLPRAPLGQGQTRAPPHSITA